MKAGKKEKRWRHKRSITEGYVSNEWPKASKKVGRQRQEGLKEAVREILSQNALGPFPRGSVETVLRQQFLRINHNLGCPNRIGMRQPGKSEAKKEQEKIPPFTPPQIKTRRTRK